MKVEPKNEINVTKILLPNSTEEKKDFFYTPEADGVFRAIFGSSGNEHITKKLFESIFEKSVEDFSLKVNPEFTKKYISEKKQTVDVKAVCKNSGNIIIMEMQNKAIPEALKRFSSYAERAHLEGLKKGLKYEELPKVILIVIMAENLPEFKNSENYYHIFNDRDKYCPETVFCYDVTKYVIELPKYIKLKENTKPEEIENIINPWLEFIIDPLGKVVKEKVRTEKEIREAVELLRKLNSDDVVREIYEEEEWARFVEYADRQANIDAGRREGRKEGRKEGREEGKTEIIKTMLNNGISMEQIANMLKLKISDVEEMIKEKNAIA